MKTLLLVLTMFPATSYAQVLAIPTRYIPPEEVVQDSIRLVRFSTNEFAVRWSYTETGAKNMLAFEEAHDGQEMRVIIGSYESPLSHIHLSALPPGITNYAQWKAGWIKRRTDKIVGLSEDDAGKIIAGLKDK